MFFTFIYRPTIATIKLWNTSRFLFDFIATLRQCSANGVTTLRSCNFTKCLTKSFQPCVDFTSDNIFVFLGKLPLCGQSAIKCVNAVKSLALAPLLWRS